MQSTLARIEDIINNLAPEWVNTHLVPRGFPYFVDAGLRGTTRFSKKLGAFLPNIAGDNLSTLASSAAVPDTVIYVNNVLTNFAPDSVISIGPGLELVKISDIGDNGEIVLTSSLKTNHSAGEKVQLYAMPVSIVGTVVAGQTTFNIRSDFPVFQGDKLWIDSVIGSLESSVSYDISIAAPVPPWPNSGVYTTTLTISPGMPRGFVDGDVVYLRAFPAYQSGIVHLPAQPRTSISVGPFVVDYLSGRVNDGEVIREQLNLQVYTAGNVPLLGAAPAIAQKNYPIINLPIANSMFLFSDVIKGRLGYRNGKLLLKTDSSGQFALSMPLVPAFPGIGKPNTGSWNAPVKLKSSFVTSGIFRVKFEPNGYQDTALVTDSLNIIPISVGGASDATRMEIVFASAPNSYLEMDTWFPQTNNINYLTYNIVSEAVGDTNWQAGSLQIKPYFLSIDSLVSKFDFDKFNAGKIML